MDWAKRKPPRKGQREVPSLKKSHPVIPTERIITEVAKAGNVQAKDLQNRKTKLKVLRQIAMDRCYRCSNLKQKEIGAINVFKCNPRCVKIVLYYSYEFLGEGAL